MRLPFDDALNYSTFVVHIAAHNASETLPILAAIADAQVLHTMQQESRDQYCTIARMQVHAMHAALLE